MNTKSCWQFIFRASGLCLTACAVVFMSVPTVSAWKKNAGVACAIFGTIFIVAMYFVKKVEHAEELQLINRELQHLPLDAEHHAD